MYNHERLGVPKYGLFTVDFVFLCSVIQLTEHFYTALQLLKWLYKPGYFI